MVQTEFKKYFVIIALQNRTFVLYKVLVVFLFVFFEPNHDAEQKILRTKLQRVHIVTKPLKHMRFFRSCWAQTEMVP